MNTNKETNIIMVGTQIYPQRRRDKGETSEEEKNPCRNKDIEQ